MKKNIGSALALYPMPMAVIGAMNGDKPTWTLVDVYETPNFESFIRSIDGTYVEEKHVNEAGKVDCRTLKPVLFEFPTYEYLATGEVLGKCLSSKENREG